LRRFVWFSNLQEAGQCEELALGDVHSDDVYLQEREAVAVNSVNEALVVDHGLVVVRPVSLGPIDGPGCKGGIFVRLSRRS